MKLDANTGLKHCNMCNQDLPSSAFRKDSSRRDGLDHMCKVCKSKASAIRHRADPETHRTASRQYYRTHTQQHLANVRNYYKAHKKELAAYSAEWHRQHPEYARKNAKTRRATLVGAAQDGSVTIKALNELLATWTGTCPFCLQEAKPTIDHIVPLAAGGAHMMTNLQLMCKSCNSSKGSKQ